MPQRKEKDVPTRTQSIRNYCLWCCDRLEKKNSKRAVAECINRECPLHPYRTGAFRIRKGPLTDGEKNKRIERLEVARRKVTYAENNLKRAYETLEFRTSVYQKYVDKVEERKKELEEAKERVKKMEKNFNDELERGLWK